MAELQTLSKALDILNILGKNAENLSVEDISVQLEIPESTTYRLLQTLEKKGFVERQARGSIGLGYNILNLARDIYEKIDRQLCIIATPIMEELTEHIVETSLLSVRSDLYSTALKSIPSKERIRFVADEKRLLPIHLGVSGKAILAFENKKIINLTMQSLDSDEAREALREDLESIRERGYAISLSEVDMGTLGVGVPVYNSFHQIYASLAVIGPSYRMDVEEVESKIYPELKNASEKITEQLSKY